ncbi:UDP-N-acetyl-alpha-D-glucosamine C6 dehydratase [Lacunisphaera limnophila]|uniref:UDP-N-acetyl-alpha-D-glucosamine C6 dehydratase n=1 Tax=Lacunisphaera limnophila TaxID=1838286 RepID=A0A1D8AVX6_9BACT|nr:nucleoside-diphosphate sugar epimerase/dehydratase [Lacunisphaera limnophila]AOS45005.1 UDP-N-acetyl-alpha-D-glucosamine C6 dehydratase [Lacunisphaera limnophila]
MKAFLSGIGLRFWVTVCAYVAVLTVSFYLAYELRFDFALPAEFQVERLRLLPYAVAVKFLGLVLLRQMGSMLRYFSIPDLIRVTTAMAVSSALLIAPRLLGQADYVFPRGVLLIDLLLSVVGLCAFRIGLRVYQERGIAGQAGAGHRVQEIVIVGAGDTGASLAKELLSKPARGLKPVAFLDDDPDKRGRLVHGIPVLGRPDDFSRDRFPEVHTVVVAMPSAAQRRVKEIVLRLVQLGCKVEIIPAIEDLASGRAKASHLRAVEVEDLLGRDAVSLDTTAIRRFVENKVVMVTGAGGSIGAELCRQIARLNPQRLLMVEQSEVSLFQIEQEMNELGMGAISTPLVGSILDQVRMNDIFSRFRPQVVFHAAAHKHVYMMERQPSEAVRNNSIGTRLLGEIAAAFKTEAFVLISTDKAINPTNVMGASKRLAEIHLQALQARLLKAEAGAQRAEVMTVQSAPVTREAGFAVAAKSGPRREPVRAGSGDLGPAGEAVSTKFMAVRFGNVLGSSGSVVPIFRKQIAAGGPVTVTHPDVTRYFMTIPEAVGLVMQAAVMGKGGEIFVLDMGQPVKIADLARQMIELSGLAVGDDIEIKFTGLKPGEKLYEELQHQDERHLPTEHPRVMRFVPSGDATAASAQAIDQLEPILYTVSPNPIKEQIKSIIPEYTPYLE